MLLAKIILPVFVILSFVAELVSLEEQNDKRTPSTLIIKYSLMLLLLWFGGWFK